MRRDSISENKQMVEEIDHSCEGLKVQWCARCGEKTFQQFTSMSSEQGEVWTCLKCGAEDASE